MALGLATSRGSDQTRRSGYDAFLSQSLGKRKRAHTAGIVGFPSPARPALDEYKRYIQSFTPADDKYQFRPLSWWQEHEMEYPNLSRMAADMLSIPTMSAETERSFSSAGRWYRHYELVLIDTLLGWCRVCGHGAGRGIVLRPGSNCGDRPYGVVVGDNGWLQTTNSSPTASRSFQLQSN